MVYVSPPGNKIITFYTDDASSISPGSTVRIAGVTVGKIKDVAIEPQQVRVRATVDGSAFIGDQSQVEVRMLTPVGGYYVMINSLGDTPLGARPISRDRVVLPYNLVRTLVDATEVIDRVETAPINQSLNEIQRGLTGPNLDVISSVVDAGSKLIETVDRQRGQVSAILDMSDEYLAELSNYRDQFRQMIEKIAIIEQTLVIYNTGFGVSVKGLGMVVERLGSVGRFYMNHREEFLAKFIHWQQIIQSWADRSGLVVRILKRTRDRMQRTLDAQNAPPELLATDLCIPVPGGPC